MKSAHSAPRRFSTRRWCVPALEARTLGTSAKSIKAAAAGKGREVIVAARGNDKAKAIHAIIKGGWCNCLVTDVPTAKAVLRVARSS